MTEQNVTPLHRDQERWVSRRELSDIMGVGQRTIANWVNEGMPSETWGLRARRFLPSACIAWAKKRSTAA